MVPGRTRTVIHCIRCGRAASRGSTATSRSSVGQGSTVVAIAYGRTRAAAAMITGIAQTVRNGSTIGVTGGSSTVGPALSTVPACGGSAMVPGRTRTVIHCIRCGRAASRGSATTRRSSVGQGTTEVAIGDFYAIGFTSTTTAIIVVARCTQTIRRGARSGS